MTFIIIIELLFVIVYLGQIGTDLQDYIKRKDDKELLEEYKQGKNF